MRPLMRKLQILILLFLAIILAHPLQGKESSESFYFRGAFYLDWFGAKYQDSPFYNQLSARFKIELFNRRGTGWTFLLDTRDRFRFNNANNQLLVYDARLIFEKPENRFSFSVGQMNLYDTAGIGQLLGGVLGYKLFSDLLVGGYAGLESNIYVDRLEKDYYKFGLFARYLGNLGKRFSLSFNHIHFLGKTEQQYVYASCMYPVKKFFVFYGNMEFQLARNVDKDDRLSRLFVNLRFDPTPYVDLTAFYSLGRGLDFHYHLLKSSQYPTLSDRELERYYYSMQYGFRLSAKPLQGLRVFLSRQEREQKDDGIKNHAWLFGFSAVNILNTSFSAHGDYTSNRGDISESDSYYFSISKDFGRISWQGSFSNTFNGLRFDYRSFAPQIIHLNDYMTLSTFFFITISRALAVSVQYEFLLQEESNQHSCFVRLIYRK
jgi:hypothetical protein